jgi:hypothetical protein
MSLSSLLKNTFNKYPLNHSFNYNNIDKFLDACHPSVKNICVKIFLNTIHISFETFLTQLNINVADIFNFITPKRPIFILIDKFTVDNYKFKSNYWLYTYVQNYIKYKTSNNNNNIILIDDLDDKRLIDNDLIILVDDCVYSGLQMSFTLKNLKNKNKLKLKIFLLIPFITTGGYNKIYNAIISIPDLKKYCNVYLNKHYNLISPIKDFLTTNEIKLINKFYGNLQNFNYSYLIYFDHKLADTASTLTLFYLGFIPNKKNQKFFEELFKIVDYDLKNNITNNFYKKYNNFINSKDFDIIPVINNCQNYTKKLDIWSPKCPYPPYKKGFFDFIKEIKKNKKIKSLSLDKYGNKKKIKSF